MSCTTPNAQMNMLVQSTNDSSILSKKSMVDQGYFDDPFIKYFTSKSVRRSPLINLGYYVRASVMNLAIKFYAELFQGSRFQVVSFGAGYDTTFFRLNDLFKDSLFIEIDLEGVVRNKINFIRTHPELHGLLTNMEDIESPYGMRSQNYVIFDQDLHKIPELEKALLSLGFKFSVPTILFSECAITYMEPESSTNLIKWAGLNCKSGVILIYEQIFPYDSFGQIMRKHFLSLNTPIKSVVKYPTPTAQARRLSECEWTYFKSHPAMDIYTSVLQSDLERVIGLEPFDEWEEWHLKCCHYALSVGTTEKIPQLEEVLNIEPPTLTSFCVELSGTLIEIEVMPLSVKRYGHSMVQLSPFEFLVTGGFGPEDNKHCRMNTACLLNLKMGTVVQVPPSGFNLNERAMYRTTTPIPGSCDNPTSFLMYGGRLSPMVMTSEDFLVTLSVGNEVMFKCNKLEINGSQPCRRHRHTMVNTGQKSLLYGGLNSSIQALNDLWLFDPVNSTWEEIEVMEIPGMKPCSRFSHSAVVHGSQMIVSGGLCNSLEPLGDLWSFNIVTHRWTELHITGVLPRYSHTSHMIKGSLVLIGGVNTLSYAPPGVGVIDLDRRMCFEYYLPNPSPERPIFLHNHQSLVSENDVIIVGGGGNCFSFGTYFNPNLLKLHVKSLV